MTYRPTLTTVAIATMALTDGSLSAPSSTLRPAIDDRHANGDGWTTRDIREATLAMNRAQRSRAAKTGRK